MTKNNKSRSTRNFLTKQRNHIWLFISLFIVVFIYIIYVNQNNTKPTNPSHTPTPTNSVLSLDLTFTAPNGWDYKENVTQSDLSSQEYKIAGNPNKYLTDKNGCAIYFGPTIGGHGPSRILTNEDVLIDGHTFNKRSWYRNSSSEIPFFIYYSSDDESLNANQKSIWAWVPEGSGSSSCFDKINKIISSVELN